MIGKAGGAAVFEPSTTVDARKLEGIIEKIEEDLATNQLTLKLKKRARLILLLYEHSMEAGKDVDGATGQKYLGLIG